jgi:hypothetical protein
MRYLLLVFLLIGIMNTSYSQVEFTPYAQFGVKGGGSFSNMFLENRVSDVPFYMADVLCVL